MRSSSSAAASSAALASPSAAAAAASAASWGVGRAGLGGVEVRLELGDAGDQLLVGVIPVVVAAARGHDGARAQQREHQQPGGERHAEAGLVGEGLE